MRSIFTAIVNNRHDRPKSYSTKKLARLREYFGTRLKEEPDACTLRASVSHSGRTITWLFHIK